MLFFEILNGVQKLLVLWRRIFQRALFKVVNVIQRIMLYRTETKIYRSIKSTSHYYIILKMKNNKQNMKTIHDSASVSHALLKIT